MIHAPAAPALPLSLRRTPSPAAARHRRRCEARHRRRLFLAAFTLTMAGCMALLGLLCVGYCAETTLLAPDQVFCLTLNEHPPFLHGTLFGMNF